MPSRLSRTKKTLIGTSVALGSFGIGGATFALVNGGGATAAGTAPAATSATNPGATQGQKVRTFLRRHTVHSTLSVQTKNGFETVNLIRGTVTAWGGGSITVKAADNSTVTASVTPQTKFHNTSEQALATGQKVGLVAVGGNARLIAAPASPSTAS